MAKVSDEQGSGSAQTNVVVKQRAALSARQLPDVLFAQNSDRVNNCGKRVLLEELRRSRQIAIRREESFSSATLRRRSRPPKTWTLKRALNAAAVISAGQGVCTSFPASQILVNAAGAAENGVRLPAEFLRGLDGSSGETGSNRSRQRRRRQVPARRSLVRAVRWRAPAIGSERERRRDTWREQPGLSAVIVRIVAGRIYGWRRPGRASICDHKSWHALQPTLRHGWRVGTSRPVRGIGGDCAGRPPHRGVVVAATSNAQIFRSEDSGDSWKALPFPAQLRATLHALVVDRRNPGVYFVGLSSDTPKYSGIMRTFRQRPDMGANPATWVDEPYGPSPSGQQDSRVMAAGGEHGLWLTRDGGETWEQITPSTFPS